MNSIRNLSVNNVITQANIQKNNNVENLKSKINNAEKTKDNQKLMEVCKEFESIFIHMMLKQMRSTVPDSGITNKSTAREIFEDMYDQEVAKQVSNQGEGIGIAKVLYEQMKNSI
ncbi:rod-binding protein [Caldisalinibacter kiritimatiensis]|uniref:Flagellar protein FlgJ n=1 Tax=Caldisalinibacter kiritimatiensis TaxID=1304284 RepID=R1CEK0_9FIRM|nr:rod-binding protein [Caldisalinibacter kiritimatiensis]EOD00725.1 Flagellar protein FlgJ [Caldisalinibacter kiritimatiensis]